MNEIRVIKIWVLAALLWLPLGCAQQKSKPITEVSQEELAGGILIDVRTPEEYGRGHLEGALNVDWFRADFLSVIDTLPKDNTLYLYCKKGGRSAKATHLLDSLGYRVIDLPGGYDAWHKANP